MHHAHRRTGMQTQLPSRWLSQTPWCWQTCRMLVVADVLNDMCNVYIAYVNACYHVFSSNTSESSICCLHRWFPSIRSTCPSWGPLRLIRVPAKKRPQRKIPWKRVKSHEMKACKWHMSRSKNLVGWYLQAYVRVYIESMHVSFSHMYVCYAICCSCSCYFMILRILIPNDYFWGWAGGL